MGFFDSLLRRTGGSRDSAGASGPVPPAVDQTTEGAPSDVLPTVPDAHYPGAEGRVFPVWKKVRLGVQKTPEAYEDALDAQGFRIGAYARQILKNVSVSQVEIEFDLALVTPGDLGLENPTYQQIRRRAVELGLEECPPEVGPALRLAYRDSPPHDVLPVAMRPEPLSGVPEGFRRNNLLVLQVGNDGGGPLLGTLEFRPLGTWSSESRLIFVRPRR